jgi:hypothetical protein
MLPMGFEPTISAGERPKTYALAALQDQLQLVNYREQTKKELPSSIYDSTYAWRDNILTLKTCTGTYRNKW